LPCLPSYRVSVQTQWQFLSSCGEFQQGTDISDSCFGVPVALRSLFTPATLLAIPNEQLQVRFFYVANGGGAPCILNLASGSTCDKFHDPAAIIKG
jgi:hypothetical protein